MLHGIYQYSQNHPELPLEDLSKPTVQYLDKLKKSNAGKGYSGASFINIELFEDGGLKCPMTVTSLADDTVDLASGNYLDLGFGTTDANGDTFVEFKKPRLNQDSYEWPSDEFVQELYIHPNSWMTYVLYSLGGVSFLLILSNIVNSFNHIVRKIPFDVRSWIMVIGSSLLTGSGLLTIGRMNGNKCRSRSYLEFIAFALVFSTTALKAFRSFLQKNSYLRRNSRIPFLFLFVVAAVSTAVNTLTIYAIDKDCSMSISKTWNLLYAFNGFLVLQAAVLSKFSSQRELSTHRFSFLCFICMLAYFFFSSMLTATVLNRFSTTVLEMLVAIGTSLYSIVEMDSLERYGKDDNDIFFVDRRPTGWDLGSAVIAEKSLFGWCDPVKCSIVFHQLELYSVMNCIMKSSVWTFSLSNFTELDYIVMFEDIRSIENASELPSDLDLAKGPNAAAQTGGSLEDSDSIDSRRIPKGVMLFLPNKTFAIMWKKKMAASQGLKILEILKLSVEGKKSITPAKSRTLSSML
ncbi:hypothetical protein HDU97_009494 [Phlyctochytrium planicorne]|nr:hypothetical protein HDU97_009494 [Phlyctochytrium planicorne]